MRNRLHRKKLNANGANRNWLWAGLALLALFGVAWAMTPARAQKAAGNIQSIKVGPFQVWFGLLVGSTEKGIYAWNFTGPRGGKVRAKTLRYDLNAPRITMIITPTSVPKSAAATGGVDGEARDPVRQQVVGFRGDKAVYRAAAGSAPARIDFTGDVRFVFRSPQFEPGGPLTVNAASASLLFDKNGKITYTLSNGDATGTPVEPEPTKKP